MKSSSRRFFFGVALALFLALQFAPHGGGRVNPPTIAEPSWDSPETRALAIRACFDCHSNETVWPVYSRIAPTSWIVQRNVSEGRAALNFSEWQRRQKEADEAAEKVLDREMPPGGYQLMHSRARLTPVERERLARGLERTVAARDAAHGGR
jgi:hypothetical protein